MKTRKRQRIHGAAPFVLAALVVGFGACSGRTDSFVVDADAIPECEGYLAKYRACMKGASGASALDERVATMRRGFLAVANRNEAERAQLRASCASGADRLQVACR